jgi:D-alanine-D-alanine ligase
MRVALAINCADNYSRGSLPEDVFEEFDSRETVTAISREIASFGHHVTVLEADRTFPATVAEGKFELVFNLAEGFGGRCRESQVPAVCEMLGIPYSGSDALTMGLTLDKALAKTIVGGNVPIAAGRVFRPGQTIDLAGLRCPLMVKPNAEGSSKGIRNSSRAATPEAAMVTVSGLHQEYGCPVLVEEFLEGPECTVGVVGNQNPRVIGIMEIVPRNVPVHDFVYSLETKRDYQNQVDYRTPPAFSPETCRRIAQLACQAFLDLECRDLARIDFRLDRQGVPHFIEANPLPGLSPVKGDLVIMAGGNGGDYHTLIGEILNAALSRQNLL